MAEAIREEELVEFITNGYLLLPPSASFPESFHKSLYDRSYQVCAKHGSRGMPEPPKESRAQVELWDSPEMSAVIGAPEVQRVLQGVLGANYMVFPHRHVHTTTTMWAQHWHQDPSISTIRSHRCRAVLAMYYPGDVRMELGPTGLLPGSQYMGVDRVNEVGHSTSSLVEGQFDMTMQAARGQGQVSGLQMEDSINESAREWLNPQAGSVMPRSPVFGECRAGSIIVNHYEIIHRGTLRRVENGFRPMYKWLIVRMEAPSPMPSLAAAFPDQDHVYGGASKGQLAIWRCMWDWHRGVPDPATETAEEASVEAAAAALQTPGRGDEMERLGAAYRLGRIARAGGAGKEYALLALIAGLSGEVQCTRRVSMYGLVEAGPAAFECLVAMAEAPVPAVDDKAGIAVRNAATYALGEVASGEGLERAMAALSSQQQVIEANLVAYVKAQAGNPAKACNDEMEAWIQSAKGQAFMKSEKGRAWAASPAGQQKLAGTTLDASAKAGQDVQGSLVDRACAKISIEMQGQPQLADKLAWFRSKEGEAWLESDAGASWLGGGSKAGAKAAVVAKDSGSGWFGGLFGGGAKAGGNAGGAAANKGGLAPEYAANFAWTTCGALWTVFQAAALAGTADAYLPKLQELHAEAISAVKITNPGHGLTSQHKPCELDMLTMAAVSACTRPGARQAAFVTEGTPPFTYSDRFPSMFLALAKARLETSGACGDGSAAALQQMIAKQSAMIASPPAERFALGRSRNAATPEWEDAYEARVFPALLAGDARPFYSLGSPPVGAAL